MNDHAGLQAVFRRLSLQGPDWVHDHFVYDLWSVKWEWDRIFPVIVTELLFHTAFRNGRGV